jgi:protein tyrosine phosphatase (PTP) superfamily phosphohydrolase (DUF442 family)
MQISGLRAVIACFILWATLCSCAANTCAGLQDEALRPAVWARPVAVAGVPNLHKVDDALYRSAQPTTEGMRELKELGIRTVVDLRFWHSDLTEIGDTGLGYVSIPMTAFHPTEDEAVAFLKAVTDPGKIPVLVHCKYGADRTGVMVAVYRVAVQGWAKDDAVREMTGGCYGFNRIYTNLAPWVMGLDMEKLRREARIKPPVPEGKDPAGGQGS